MCTWNYISVILFGGWFATMNVWQLLSFREVEVEKKTNSVVFWSQRRLRRKGMSSTLTVQDNSGYHWPEVDMSTDISLKCPCRWHSNFSLFSVTLSCLILLSLSLSLSLLCTCISHPCVSWCAFLGLEGDNEEAPIVVQARWAAQRNSFQSHRFGCHSLRW